MKAEFKLEDLRCGRVVGRVADKVFTCEGVAEWVPYVHVKIDGHEDAHALMGGHAMCTTCRLTFRLRDLFNLSMWESMVSGLAAEGIPRPAEKHIEVEWIDAETFLKQTDKRVQA